ncbi:CHASE2 domain-containing protein [Oceanidesulfovibrio indonesiensis]|uniref:CHASE2 domain-containing protein n=1 Tax=Oceanidesulfovibrio indonesiensis TaxID=54767 RepID=UPI00142FE22F|nr:CHASE2 domain-containing protein [Oceanidesulfovibrio indonesiensis]
MAGLQPRIQGRPLRTVILVGLLCTMLGAVLAGMRAPPVPLADNLLYDAFSSLNARSEADDRIAVVDIDDASIAAVGQWPWPRYRMAALIEKIASAQPASIGVDILFAETDQSSLASMRQRFRRDFGLDIGFTGIPDGLEDNDGYLGHVLSKAPVLGSVYFTFMEHGADTGCLLEPLRVAGAIGALHPPQAGGVLCNVPPIQRGLSSAGFINTQPDPDGRLRRLPLLIEHAGVLYPSFTLALVMMHESADSIAIDRDFYGLFIRVGGLSIPITREGHALLRFYGPARSVTSYSAKSVLQSAGIPSPLAGRHVLVGSSAAGLNDLHHTSSDAHLSGAETQATLISNILAGSVPRVPSWNGFYHIFATMAAGAAVTALFACVTPAAAALGALLTGAFFLGMSGMLFRLEHVYLSAAGPVATAFILLMALSTILYIAENRRSLASLRRLVRAQRQTLSSMAAVAEKRDPYTGGHISRTQKYVRMLAEQLARRGTHGISQEYIELLYLSAPLHDVGKVAMPDSILLKPGQLTESEFELMKKHAEHGHAIMEAAVESSDGGEFLAMAKEIAMTHHERWDGSGYPRGLRGTEIPLSGRLMALADVYDALVSSRLYKKPYSHEKAREVIVDGSGTHFDPDIVAAFLACEEEFDRIARGSDDPPND